MDSEPSLEKVWPKPFPKRYGVRGPGEDGLTCPTLEAGSPGPEPSFFSSVTGTAGAGAGPGTLDTPQHLWLDPALQVFLENKKNETFGAFLSVNEAREVSKRTQEKHTRRKGLTP